MLTGVLSDKYIRENCWEMTAPVSFKKRVGAKPITMAPSGNMRNSFTFQSPQPTIMNLATNILAITPKKNLPANSDIVYSIAESLVKSEYVSPLQEQFFIRYNPEYDYQGGEPRMERQDREAALMLMQVREAESQVVPEGLGGFGQMSRYEQAELRSKFIAITPMSARRPGMYQRTTGIRGIYGGVEGVPDYPSPLTQRDGRQLSEQLRESYGV
jgi:hypothetical protein